MGPFFIYAGIILLLPFIFPSSTSTVILLDNNRSSNAVEVTTQGGTVLLETPYTRTLLTSADAPPQPSQRVEEAAVRERYAPVLEALPPEPARSLFYFEEGTAELTPESKRQVAALAGLIQERSPAIVDIIGHTDTVGTDEENDALARKRALSVKAFLEEQGVRMEAVEVSSYGESDPLVPTADGVPEPRNRRVEVTVR